MRSSGLLFGLLATSLVSFASTTPLKFEESSPAERSETDYRLPTAVVPNHYDIELIPVFTEGYYNFSGRVVIRIDVRVPTNVIVLHSHNLGIFASTITVYSGDTLIPISTQSLDPLRQFFTLYFGGILSIGEYNVTISFIGDLTTDMTGFYRSSYQVGNETRWLATTQFQPTSARRAFPCFDEPGFKATFSIRIAHFEDQIALSNMPALFTSSPDNTIGGRVWTQFETTAVMSTYLLAFIVSDFGQVSSTDQFFGVWARNEALNTTAFALESTETLYPIFLSTLQIPDPWPKIDQVAVPDFSAGAMENWGLITYTESLLLWQQGESSSRAQELIASVISHELAHIWFGNLVSPSWWDHLWFSEGFASLYEYLIPSVAFPEWRFAERIVTEQQLGVLIPDSLETTRPMTNVVGSPSSILASFDNVAYAKSSAIFRMLREIMREDLFSNAIVGFFNESAHGIFEPANLWAHMQTIADANVAVQNHIPIASVMDSWVTQPGYPLVTVWRNYSTMVVTFNQEKYFMNPNSPTADPESQRWWIPITFTTGINPTGCNNVFMQPDWLRAQDKAIMANNIQNTTWILAHCQGIGLYRVNYDTRNWELLTEFLKGPNFTQINPVNRAILLDDSFNLARSGYIDYSIALDLSQYLAQEADFVVWRATIPLLDYLNTILASDSYFPFWQAYQQSLISGLYQSLGSVVSAPADHETRLHRQQILNLACQLDQAAARASAEYRFNLWISDPVQNPVDPDLRSVVYCWGVRSASEATWNIMWDRFLTTDLATEKDLLLRSLACIQNSTILESYLQLSITANSGIRMQDTFTVFTSILTSGSDNIDMLLNFVQHNAQAVSQFYGGFNGITRMLTNIARRITRQDQLEQFRVVANSEDLGVSAEAIEGVIQTATANLDWIANHAPAIREWMQDQGMVPETTTQEVAITTLPPTTPIATTTPQPTIAPEPTTTPEPTTITEPTITAVPTTTPQPTTTIEPTITPEPTTTPELTTTPYNGAAAFTSSLFFIFISAMMCTINY